MFHPHLRRADRQAPTRSHLLLAACLLLGAGGSWVTAPTPAQAPISLAAGSRPAEQPPEPRLRTSPQPAADAVVRGLAWLARSQREDGSWSAPALAEPGNFDDLGVTGLSLLAFLGEGHTHREGDHRGTVRRGLRWLKEQQDPEGCFGPRGHPQYTYGHGIATLAMVEGYSMTRSGVWKVSAIDGVQYVLAAQNPYKAWRYGHRPGDNDTSVTVWMVMALKAAQLSGLEVPQQHLEWAREFIEEMTDPDTGRTGYKRKGEQPVRAEGRVSEFPAELSEAGTAMGLLVRIFTGEDPETSPMIEAGTELLAKRPPLWDEEKGSIDMVYWYFGSLAMFQVGGAGWDRWREELLRAVIPNQVREGEHAGSWPPAGAWGPDGGRVCSTALLTMALEAANR